ncbi:MAG: lytic transglycosylase domain-containing protein [Alphaproteobacteria bacterium]|nr:lytic transglycosylase domain-containing protein [Alphaproteobacteria bacterium]
MPGPLPPLHPRADQGVIRSLAEASRRSGVDFRFLVAQADMESGLDTTARAATSSAAGLFQFIEQTWLGLMREHGSRLGLGELSRAIEADSNGRLRLADARTRQKLLDLRHDGRIAAELGAEYARANARRLEGVLGRPAQPVEIYLAHFLGPGGAAQFLKARAENGTASAAALLPAAAEANRAVFYESNGLPRSLDQVHARFAAKLDERMARLKDMAGHARDTAPPVAPARAPGLAFASTSMPARPDKAAGIDAGALASLPSTWLLFAIGVLPDEREAPGRRDPYGVPPLPRRT